MHQALQRALTHEDVTRDAIQSPQPTVGDEIQGIYPSLGTAIRATHLIRLQLRTHNFDIRFGLGHGHITVIDPHTRIQDGSAWWAARSALQHTEKSAQQPGYAAVRTSIMLATGPHPATDLTHLIDACITSLNPSTTATLLGLLEQEPNATTAQRLGITPSANTQRIARNNLRPLAAAMQNLWTCPSVTA